MINDQLITELSRLHNNQFFENKRINGLIIKLYKRLRKELHKYNSGNSKETEFHKDIALYAAGIIGFYSQRKSLNDYLFPKLKNIYDELKVIKQPFALSIDKELPDEELIFGELIRLSKKLNLNESGCFKLFRTLQKVYLLKKHKPQGIPGLSHIELITMSIFFNFSPKPVSRWEKDWTVPIFSYFCKVHKGKGSNQSEAKITQSISNGSNLQQLNEKRNVFWSWFRKQ